MPLKNRVTPWGEIISTSERGLFMGNRGCLHNDQRHVFKAWARPPWVTCVLQFRGRHREVMSPGLYTELFFLDEATALAAGHRPCGTCRRADFNTFKDYWLSANPELVAITGTSMTKIDKALHSERVDSSRQKHIWPTILKELPDATIVVYEGSRSPLLVWRGGLYTWTPGGYVQRQVLPSDVSVNVLTPPSVVNVLKAGYQPLVHASALS